MSGNYVVADQIAELERWVGFHEGSNNQNPFSLWQGYGTSRLPWCDSFAQFCAVEAGGFAWPDNIGCQFGVKGDGYVPFTVTHAKAMGIWRPPSHVARPGWQSVYDWTWNGEADHIETVISDSGGTFVTVGGNTGNAVLYRKRSRAYVSGFVALDEAGQNHPNTPAPPAVEALVTTVACPDPIGGTARAIPALKAVMLYGNAKLTGDKASGADRVWQSKDAQVIAAGSHLIDIAATTDGKGIWALYDLGDHDIRSYFVAWRT